MEACYINTAHPGFLSGHQAITLVNEQLQAKNHPNQISDKPHPVNGRQPPQQQQQQQQQQQSQQQLAALQTNNLSSASLDVNSDSNNGSFFGSFFSGPKKTKKVTGALMEAVSHLCLS